MNFEHNSSERQQEFKIRFSKIFDSINYNQKQKLLDSLSHESQSVYLKMEEMNQTERMEMIDEISLKNSIWEIQLNLPIELILKIFHEPPDLNETISLNEYINENQKILSILSLFIAVNVFSKNLPIKILGDGISFFSLGIIVLLSFEIMFSFPFLEAEIRLKYFGNFFIAIVLALIFYWLIEFRELWQGYMSHIIFIIFTIINYRFSIVTRTHLWIGKQKVFSLRIKAKIIRSRLILLIINIAIIAIYLVVSKLLSDWILTLIDVMVKYVK